MPRPVGRKIGFTNRSIWPRYEVYEPIWGTVYDSTLVLAAAGNAVIPLDGLKHPRIEPEICFKLAAVPPRGASPARLLDSIEWAAHSIEIVQCERADWKVTLADCAAQNALHGLLVVGAPLAVCAGMADALPKVKVVLRRNGRSVEEGVGANALDSPLAALAHLVELLAKDPGARPLAAGEIISTGTLTDAYPVAPGETWRTELSGLPLAGLELKFA